MSTARAAKFFWKGDLDRFSMLVDLSAPGCLDFSSFLNRALVRTGIDREGISFRAEELDEYQNTIGPYNRMWRACMEIESVATEAARRAQASLEILDSVVREFRQRTKNDLSSMKAASDKVQSEVEQMARKYSQAAHLLTTPEFKEAIKNAERMAEALKAIQGLTETKLSFAVFGDEKAVPRAGRQPVTK